MIDVVNMNMNMLYKRSSIQSNRVCLPSVRTIGDPISAVKFVSAVLWDSSANAKGT